MTWEKLDLGGFVDISGNAFDCIHRRTVTRDSPVIRDICKRHNQTVLTLMQK